MKRIVLVVGLLACVLAVIGVASATAYSPPPNKQNPNPDSGSYPYAYGGKITALRPPISEWALPGGPADMLKLPVHKPPLDLPTFGTDVNIAGGNETFIASNPANPLNFIAGANLNGRFTTTDGGVTWNAGTLGGGGDPAGAFDASGNAYFAELGNTSSCPDNPYFYKSTNGGINWTNPTMPIMDPSPSDHFFDKEWITVDNNPTSPYFGRIYYTASNFHTPPGCNLNAYIDNAEQMVYSSDQGTTWSTRVNINDASHDQNQFTNPVAARDGTLYVGYQYQNCTFNCTSSMPMVNLIGKSTNGGVSFSPSITITNQPISPTGAFSAGYQYLYAGSTASGFRHNDQAIIGVSPTNANQVYALWTDGRWDTSFVYQGITGQHADIAFSRSTDGGNTWSAPVRVNDDPQGNGKDQFFPWMTVGTNGVIHASWSDRRDSPTGFQYREYYSQSSDGGLTWAANLAVADVGGTPSTFIGDYSGLAVNSNNTLVLPVWTDMRSGQRAYIDRGVMSTGGTATPTAIATATSTPTPGSCSPTWTAGPNISPARHLFQGAVGSDGMFYIFGGQTSASTATAVPNVERYDPASNTWQQRAGLPVPVGQDSVGAMGGNIYVAGGFIGGTVVTSTLQIYNVANNTWSFGPSMPQFEEAGAGVAFENKLYVIGGDDFNNALTNVQMFDPVSNQWTARAPLPAGRTNTSATAYGGFIYVFGGALQSGTAFVADDHLLRYSPTANTWTDLGSAGTGGNGNYGTITPFGNNKLLVTDGGTSNFQPVATTHIYDISSGTWTAGPTMATARLGEAWGQLPDGRIIEAGGLGAGTPQPVLASTEILSSCGAPTNTPIVTVTNTPIVTVTNTPTRTNTPSGNTPTRTPTPCGTGDCWAPGPPLPAALVRGVGVWYANGLNRFYIMGGRGSDSAGSDYQNPRYYDPVSSNWTIDTAVFPDNQVNNMACADLNGPSGHRIYCVGGSAAGATTATNAVRMFDPNAHTVTALSSDAWPAPTDTLPGGFAVVNNKLYILGGFTINTSMSRQIWQFDPNAAAGARWTLKTAQVPDPGSGSNGLGYVPATTIGNYIYTAGGSMWDGSTLVDTSIAFRYDPATDVVDDNAVPDLPAPGTAETKAVNEGGKVWVIFGGRTAPNPSSAVLQFDPTNPGAGWVVVCSATTGRRNFPVDVDPATGTIYLAGGYMPTTATDSTLIHQAPQPCGTVTNTPTQVRTNTPTRTPGQGTPTFTFTRTSTPVRTITPCAGCNMEMLAVVTSCYLDGTVHWIAIVHNPDPCGTSAPWRAELQVRNNGGNFRAVRIQYATNYFGSGDIIMDGFFCYHFSNNVRDVRVEYLFEDQDGVSRGSKAQVQERVAPPNSYSTTPDSGIPTAKSKSGNHNPNSPAACDADMASVPMAPCSSTGTCSGPPTPLPTGVVPILTNK